MWFKLLRFTYQAWLRPTNVLHSTKIIQIGGFDSGNESSQDMGNSLENYFHWTEQSRASKTPYSDV